MAHRGHHGERTLEKNIRQTLGSHHREERQKNFWELIRRIFSPRALREQDAIIEKLKLDLVNERLENKRLLDANQRLRQENEAYRVQVESLFRSVDMEDFEAIFEKAGAFDRLGPSLSWLRQWAEQIGGVSERFEIRKVCREMYEELKEARDGFQKIKIYRRYLARFEAFPLLGGWLEPFRKDKEKVKDRNWMTQFLTEIRNLADLEKDLELLMGQVGSKAREALNAFFSREMLMKEGKQDGILRP